METVLYDYWRSSASYRLRIALNLADIPYRSVEIDLVAGAQRDDAHIARNPQGLVPVLEIDGHSFTQSLAILDYLNDTRALGLVPADAAQAAHVRAIAHTVAVDVHPVCNLGVISHVAAQMPENKSAREEWMQRFIPPGLRAFEALLATHSQTPFCVGNAPGLADICLMPQIYNAERWGIDYSDCPRIIGVVAACNAHEAFVAAHPDRVKPAYRPN